MVRVDGLDGARHSAFADWLSQARRGGVPFTEQVERMPRNGHRSRAIYVRTYATKDAALAVACGSPSLRREFIAAVGHHDLGRSTARCRTRRLHYARFARGGGNACVTHDGGVEGAARRGRIRPVGWHHRSRSSKIPQPAANGMFHRFDHASLGPVTVLGPPVRAGRCGSTAGDGGTAVRQRGARDSRAGRASTRRKCSGC